MPEEYSVDWSAGEWTNPPGEVHRKGTDLVVKAEQGSDAWRHTSYGFVAATEHALVAPFKPGTAIEVEFTAPLLEQFDQAGLFIRASDEHWVKAGLEFADGQVQAGAVVTNIKSDWSSAPHQQWQNKRVVIRASWTGDALTVRAGLAREPLELVRVAPFSSDGSVSAGPYAASPTKAGFEVTFHSWRITAADGSLHPADAALS
ncbi:DUF1349 domain-containing protein [Arthrobacter sp. B1I2]|uniref:DUF1349 domain-containing protein n=1 Tax=Arthrobacter sp. B1I2 TaxID=3042263 RepID=UPI00277D2DC3|nr:DUF1349 domain-containing protein [Arthrobacter sp. B1I2]MDQ0730159.1 regulation of enolase protein 1 (concanavalin A-like superfamily) [Arthrobacter sp. B1I2]